MIHERDNEQTRADGARATTASAATTAAAMEQRLTAFAEQIGRTAGTIQAKAEGWMDRKTLKQQLAGVRDGAAHLLEQLAGILQRATESGLDFNGVYRLSYLLAFVQGDQETMARELKASLGAGGTNAAYGWQAHTRAYAGQISEAHDLFRQGIQLARQGNFNEVAAQLAVEDAEVHAIAGQCGPARAEAAEGLAASRDNEVLERASRALALCGGNAEAQSLLDRLAAEYPQATLTHRVAIPITMALIALNRNEPQRALDVLEGVRPYDHAASFGSWSKYLRGQAYLQMGDGPSAAAQFKVLLDHRGEAPVSMLHALARAGIERAAALQASR